jgi:serine/threonine-protein kinase
VARGLKKLRPLGRGGMGTVTLARDLDLDRVVAIKALTPELVSIPGFAERFREEAAILARVTSPWVVQVHSFGVEDGLPFFVMQHVDGPSLRAMITEHAARGATLSPVRALSILRRVAQGLGDLHAQGVVHRDVKPDNVVVERGTGRPVLVDLGLGATAFLDDGLREVGTAGYMPPEAFEARRDFVPTAALDVYAFGCMAYEVLTGHPPFRGETPVELARKHVTEPFPSLGVYAPSLAALDRMLATLCARDPKDRPQDGHEAARLVMEGSARLRDDDASVSRARHAQKAGGGAVRVLVVEDDDAVRRFVARSAQIALFGLRCDIASASNAERARAAFDGAAPDLAVLDHALPGETGLDVLDALRARPDGDATRVVVLSANLDDELRRRYEARGVDVLLGKPVPFDRLVTALAGVAASAGWVEDRG